MTEDDLADEVIEHLSGVRRVLRRRLRGTLDGPALTATQVELLRLVEASAGISVSAAARSLHLAGNSVSTLVNQLTEAGYLRRETDPRDRRAARLFLTDAAVARLTAWRDGRAKVLGAALSALPEADRQAITRALPALRRLTQLLDEEGR
jgi:DNA-binding MarR family transcriptional regulator